MTKYVYYALTLILGLVLFSCNPKLQNTPKINNQLYLYHNGIDTVVKDYELFKQLRKEALNNPFSIDTSQNWVPKPGVSSRYIYFQIIDRKHYYKRSSTFLDSSIIRTWKKGYNINQEQKPLFKLPDTVNAYTSLPDVITKTAYFVEHTFWFNHPDSLTVKWDVIGRNDDPLYIYMCKKYGQLNYIEFTEDHIPSP